MPKKLGILLLILTLLVPATLPAHAEPTPAGVEQPYNNAGQVKLFAPATSNIRPGERYTISFNVTYPKSNNVAIKGVNAVSADPNSVFVIGSSFRIDGKNNNENNNKNNNKNDNENDTTTTFCFDVQASDSVQNVNVPITIKVDYVESETVESVTTTSNVRVLSAAPTITVSRTDLIPSNQVKAGGSFTVGFEFKNTGNAPVRDITVALELPEKLGMTRGLSSQKILGLPSGGTEYLSFDLTTARDMAPGTYQVPMSWSIGTGEAATGGKGNFSFYVSKGTGQDSSLTIQNLVAPSGTLSRGQNFSVSFDLKNEGKENASNIVVKAVPAEGSEVASRSVSQQNIPLLAPGQSRPLKFDFGTSSQTKNPNNSINIVIEYEDDTTTPDKKKITEQTITAFVNVPVKDGEDGPKSTPKLIIDKYTFDPQLVPAGSSFDMTLSFFNTNSAKTVKNIKIFLTSKENADPKAPSSGTSVFTPVDSSNTFYIDEIPPKGHVEKTITLFTIPDAVAKTYEITANFEYEDAGNNPYTATEIIGVPVIQESKLDVQELSLSTGGDSVPMGMPVSIDTDFYNTGKVTIYNLMVKVEGPFTGDNLTYYVGNFETGSTDHFSATLFPEEMGKQKGKVVFSYEDSSGHEQTIEKEFSFEVTEALPEDEMGDDFNPPSNGPSAGLIIAILAIVGGGVGYFFYRRHKKKKMDEGLEIDE